MRWDIPLPDSALAYANQVIPDPARPTLVLSPCSSHERRNWSTARYAALADHAVQRHGMKVLLCGGRSPRELEYGARIEQEMRQPCSNLIGRDTLLEFLATLQRTTVLVSPDSGPAHMATTVGTPVIGLYATSNPDRTGPYLSRNLCVNRYPEAAERYLGKRVTELRWGQRVRHPEAMELITVDDVIDKFKDFYGI